MEIDTTKPIHSDVTQLTQKERKAALRFVIDHNQLAGRNFARLSFEASGEDYWVPLALTARLDKLASGDQEADELAERELSLLTAEALNALPLLSVNEKITTERQYDLTLSPGKYYVGLQHTGGKGVLTSIFTLHTPEPKIRNIELERKDPPHKDIFTLYSPTRLIWKLQNHGSSAGQRSLATGFVSVEFSARLVQIPQVDKLEEAINFLFAHWPYLVAAFGAILVLSYVVEILAFIFALSLRMPLGPLSFHISLRFVFSVAVGATTYVYRLELRKFFRKKQKQMREFKEWKEQLTLADSPLQKLQMIQQYTADHRAKSKEKALRRQAMKNTI